MTLIALPDRCCGLALGLKQLGEIVETQRHPPHA
jgi:hypothetical protein